MDSSGELLQPKLSLELDLPPSCVGFCPAHPSYFLVGTYSLQPEHSSPADVGEDAHEEADEGQSLPAQPKQPQSRSGSIVVFRLLDGSM